MRNVVRRYVLCLLFGVWISVGALHAGAQEDELGLYARSAVLMDGDSGRILYAKEAQTELPMASTTKIMTCILALEEGTPDTVCTVSAYAASQPEVRLGMAEGDTFYLKDLLCSLMLESHNDTAVCIAETIGGSTEGFAAKMNAKAREIGCAQTWYVTPNGLDAQDAGGEHRTTACDLALVMRYCLTQSPQAEAFLEVTRTPSCVFTDINGSRSYGCTNHNAFLQIMDGALSGKTGFTSKAGYCYVGALRRGDRLLIVALLACGWPHHKGYKWIDTKKLMNYGLEHFEKREITGGTVQTGSIPVQNGQQESVETQAVQDGGIQVLMRPEEQVRTVVELLPELEAPVEAGQEAGRVRYLIGDVQYGSCPVVTAHGVAARDYPYCLRGLWEMALL